MHEWALAESVIVTAVDEIKNNKLKNISRIQVKVGELQQIDLGIFRFALENILKSYALGMDIENIIVETDKSVLKCKVCGAEWSFSETLNRLQDDETEAIHFIPEVAHIYMRCPSCKSPDFDIIKGRGVWIDSIEGET
ncbi:MAG: hydrogenase nickel incorporation protein HypA [Proteobacteria bacterium]|nr:hydrogenase nickel incorporation protein HypA [Pseudomonadota bacterium]